MMHRTLYRILLIALLLLLTGLVVSAQESETPDPTPNVAIVMDASSAMQALIDGERTHLEVASAQLQCVAEVGRGRYYEASDAAPLTEALRQASVIPQEGTLRLVLEDGTPASEVAFTLRSIANNEVYSGVGEDIFPADQYILRVDIPPVIEANVTIVHEEITQVRLPINISQSGAAFVRQPAALLADDGTLHVVWQDTTDSPTPAAYNLFYRARSPQGVWSAATNLTPGFGSMFHHSQILVRQPDGTLCVMIDGYLIGAGGPQRGLYQRCLNAEGWGDPTLLRGNVAVSDMAYTYDASGVLRMASGIGNRTILFEDQSDPLSDERLATMLRLVIDVDGRLHLIFHRSSTATTPASITHRVSTDGGATWSPIEALNDLATGRSAVNPQVAVDAQGGVHVVYSTGGAGGDAVEYRRWTAEGGWSAVENLLASFSERGQLPQIAVDADGLAHVVFRSRELYYTRQQPDDGWTPIVQAAPFGVGQHFVIVVDAAGVAHLLWDYEDRSDILYYRISAPTSEAEAGE